MCLNMPTHRNNILNYGYAFMKKYTNLTKGFTLVELMVTLAVMGIMAAIAFPSMGNFIANTRLTNRRFVWACLLLCVALRCGRMAALRVFVLQAALAAE